MLGLHVPYRTFQTIMSQEINNQKAKKVQSKCMRKSQTMKIEHVALYVSDLEQAREFFTKYFNAQANKLYHNPKTGFQSYFLSFTDGARLEIMTRPELQAPQDLPTDATKLSEDTSSQFKLGFAHLAFALGAKDAVLELTQELTKNGCELTSGPRTTGDGYFESALKCPFGVLLELTI